ncbi:unnamed protein product [Ectocarpus sp. 12 AP-2014]
MAGRLDDAAGLRVEAASLGLLPVAESGDAAGLSSGLTVDANEGEVVTTSFPVTPAEIASGSFAQPSRGKLRRSAGVEAAAGESTTPV